MNDNYEGFLKELEKIKNDTTTTKEQKDAMVGIFEASIKILENTINYQKTKARSVVNNIDLVKNNMLVKFFGNDDIIENEAKLNKLKKILKEL